VKNSLSLKRKEVIAAHPALFTATKKGSVLKQRVGVSYLVSRCYEK
jgi:hypothetical protein